MAKKTFSSSHQPDPERRSGGPKQFAAGLKKALKKRFESGEVDGCDNFEDWLVKKALDSGGIYLQLVVQRVDPSVKPTLPLVEFKFKKEGTALEKANAVYAAMASGKIAPDVGNIFIEALSKMLNIEEITELKTRLSKLEAIVNRN